MGSARVWSHRTQIDWITSVLQMTNHCDRFAHSSRGEIQSPSCHARLFPFRNESAIHHSEPTVLRSRDCSWNAFRARVVCPCIRTALKRR
jgi:hypothetical protein